jgi:virginiamycin B lyase
VTPATGAVLKNYPGYDYPAKLVFGADGNLYASESRDIIRVRISDDSIQMFYPSQGFAPYSLVAGQDGKIWFTELSGQKIGNLTTAGAFTEYTVPVANTMYQIISAADGTFWFTFGIIQGGSGDSCGIGHSTQSGTVTTYVIADCHTSGLAFGADGNIWLSEQTANKVGVFPMP